MTASEPEGVLGMADANRPPLPHDHLPQVPGFEVTSEDFTDGARMSDVFAYAGSNESPQLSWSGFPAGTKSFAVTCYDPDAPTGSGFWHWAVLNIPASTTSLPHNAGALGGASLPAGSLTLRNDYGEASYGGSAPPPGHGPHRYVFTVHAVDVDRLDVDAERSPAVLGFNLFFHTLGRGRVIGVYEVPAS